MDTAQTIASIGAIIGDPTRAIILTALLDGRAWTAGELAHHARVTPQTTSSHLKLLADSLLIKKDIQGRHHYFRLASPEIANILENLTLLASYRNEKTQQHSTTPDKLRHARTCYDHIAGQLGVKITEGMLDKNYLQKTDGKDYLVTEKGHAFFLSLGIDCALIKQQRRQFAYQCLDWSERQYHLAGALGAQLCSLFIQRKWLTKAPNSREIKVTREGQKQFQTLLSLSIPN